MVHYSNIRLIMIKVQFTMTDKKHRIGRLLESPSHVVVAFEFRYDSADSNRRFPSD